MVLNCSYYIVEIVCLNLVTPVKQPYQGDSPPAKRQRQRMDTPTGRFMQQTVVEHSPAVAVSRDATCLCFSMRMYSFHGMYQCIDF